MSALDRRDRRALWLGALVLAPVLAWRALIMPVSAWLVLTEARAEASAGLLAREQALLRDGPRLPSELASARRALSGESVHLFAGVDTAGATASMASWLASSARAAGLTSVRAEAAPAISVRSGLIGVQVDVRGSGDARALAAWLRAIERGQRLLVTERLDVTANDDGSLSVSTRVRGYALEGAR